MRWPDVCFYAATTCSRSNPCEGLLPTCALGIPKAWLPPPFRIGRVETVLLRIYAEQETLRLSFTTHIREGFAPKTAIGNWQELRPQGPTGLAQAHLSREVDYLHISSSNFPPHSKSQNRVPPNQTSRIADFSRTPNFSFGRSNVIFDPVVHSFIATNGASSSSSTGVFIYV